MMRWTIAATLFFVAILTGMLGAAVSVEGVDGLVDRMEGDGVGEFGTAHKHLYFKVSVLNRTVDLSHEQFQMRADRAHFENGDGEVLHVHAEGVDVGFTLRTLGFYTNTSCIVVGELLCSNQTHELRFVNNGDSVTPGYELSQGDNFVVWYGKRNASVDSSFFDRILPEPFRPRKPGSPI